MPPWITQESCRPRVSDRTMVGTVPSGSCLQGVRAERRPTIMKPTATSPPPAPNGVPGGHASFWRHGEIYRKKEELSGGKPQPAPAHSLSMSFQLAIPGQVALQQSLPPLRQPSPILPQTGKVVETVSRTRRRLPRQGWTPRKHLAVRPGRSVFT